MLTPAYTHTHTYMHTPSFQPTGQTTEHLDSGQRKVPKSLSSVFSPGRASARGSAGIVSVNPKKNPMRFHR